MTKTLRGADPLHVIRRKILARMLPPDPPADMNDAYLAVVKRLMCNPNDQAAQIKAQQLRAEEFRRNRECGR
jgi:hypothetical protein